MAAAKKSSAEDLDFQMVFYEGLLRKVPDYFDVLVLLGEIYTKKGLYRKGLRTDKKLAKLRPENPVVHYNLACSHSLLGDLSSSLEALDRAVRLGYDDVVYMCKDPDLSNLRKDERFTGFLQRIKKSLIPVEDPECP